MSRSLTAQTTASRRHPITAHDMLAAAHHDQDSVLALARELIAIPSRGGVDPGEPILDHTAAWLTGHGLPVRILRATTGAPVGIASEIHGHRPGKRWVLDACLDTAVYGDEHAWTHPPTDPVIRDGWLFGRGSADSKAAVSIFCHLAARLHRDRQHFTGSLTLLLDLDEHTGGFGGATTYFDTLTDVGGVMIGYPGLHHIVVGGRGVHRVRLHVHGIASHAGGRTTTPNAISKAADIITRLSAVDLPTGSGEFPPGKLTVTEISGGQGYSVTPDLCSINIDIRTTPDFDDNAAETLICHIVDEADRGWLDTKPTLIEHVQHWPPYAHPDSAPATALFAATRGLGIDVTAKIAGPSNIGNYLAGLGVPVTAGFGVDKIGEHSTDERIRIDTIPLVHAAYHTAVRDLLTSTNPR